MNERIRELWDQAAKSTAAYPSGQNTSWETQVNFMDKFAELIVRECEQVSLKNSHRNDDMGAIIARNIKKHFGIEK